MRIIYWGPLGGEEDQGGPRVQLSSQTVLDERVALGCLGTGPDDSSDTQSRLPPLRRWSGTVVPVVVPVLLVTPVSLVPAVETVLSVVVETLVVVGFLYLFEL